MSSAILSPTPASTSHFAKNTVGGIVSPAVTAVPKSPSPNLRRVIPDFRGVVSDFPEFLDCFGLPFSLSGFHRSPPEAKELRRLAIPTFYRTLT
jgi:hypothetical protein